MGRRRRVCRGGFGGGRDWTKKSIACKENFGVDDCSGHRHNMFAGDKRGISVSAERMSSCRTMSKMQDRGQVGAEAAEKKADGRKARARAFRGQRPRQPGRRSWENTAISENSPKPTGCRETLSLGRALPFVGYDCANARA